MFRYLAFVSNANSAAQAAALHVLRHRLLGQTQAWQQVVDQPGLEVFVTGVRARSTTVCRLHDGCGAVLGTLFDRSGDRKIVRLSASESARILTSEGRALPASYWGRYASFHVDRTTGKVFAFRDPTAGLPCNVCTYEGVDVYCSFLDDCVSLGLMQFPIDWQYLRTRVVSLLLAPEQTAILGVRELAGGQCAARAGNVRSQSFYWHPFDFVQPDGAELLTLDGAESVRAQTKRCVRAWASCYDHILHRLSGGLDSSIVLASLQDVPERPRITCVNYYSAGANSDERPFARLAARRAACELIEQERDSEVDLRGMLMIQRSS